MAFRSLICVAPNLSVISEYVVKAVKRDRKENELGDTCNPQRYLEDLPVVRQLYEVTL